MKYPMPPPYNVDYSLEMKMRSPLWLCCLSIQKGTVICTVYRITLSFTGHWLYIFEKA